MKRCQLCGRRIWPWQRRRYSAKFDQASDTMVPGQMHSECTKPRCKWVIHSYVEVQGRDTFTGSRRCRLLPNHDGLHE